MTSRVMRYSESSTKSSLLTISLSVRVKRFPLEGGRTTDKTIRERVTDSTCPIASRQTAGNRAGSEEILSQSARARYSQFVSEIVPLPPGAGRLARRLQLSPVTQGAAEFNTSVTCTLPKSQSKRWEGNSGGRQLKLFKYQDSSQVSQLQRTDRPR